MERTKLEAMIDELERHVPRMLRDYADASGFWMWFSGEADSMRRNAASREDRLYVCDRVNSMLHNAGVNRQLVE
jgi:hypothetical protein